MVKARKRIGRPPTGINKSINVRWPPHVLDAIDRYANAQCIERPLALRLIVSKFLQSEGVLDPTAVPK